MESHRFSEDQEYNERRFNPRRSDLNQSTSGTFETLNFLRPIEEALWRRRELGKTGLAGAN